MNMHVELTINLWWIVYYLATGLALFFPCAVALAWCINGGTMAEKMVERTSLTWWLTRPPVFMVIWPLGVYAAVDEVRQVRRARQRIAALSAKRAS